MSLNDKGFDIDLDNNISDLDYDDLENPRERELLLLSKIKILKDKLKAKVNIIHHMKETLDSESLLNQKQSNQIKELERKLEIFKDNFEDNEIDNKLAGIVIPRKLDDINLEAMREGRKYDYLPNVSALANIHQSKVYLLERQTLKGRLKLFILYLIHICLPFKENIDYIEYNYPNEVLVLFKLLRKSFITSIMILFIFIYFFFFHISSMVDLYSYSKDESLICKNYMICAGLYSRIPQSSQRIYAISLFLMSLVYVLAGIYIFIKGGFFGDMSKVYENSNKRLSGYIFNCWSWNIKTRLSYINKKNYLKKYFFSIWDEYEEIKDLKVKEIKDIIKIWSVRLICFVVIICLYIVNIIFVFLSFKLRILLKEKFINSNNDSGYIVEYSIIFLVLELIPSILITITSFSLSSLSSHIVKYQKWEVSNINKRYTCYIYFVSRLITITTILYISIYYNILGGHQVIIDFFNLRETGCAGKSQFMNRKIVYLSQAKEYKRIPYTLYSNCSEDEVSITFFMITLVDFTLSKMKDFIKVLLLKVRNYYSKVSKIDYLEEVNPGFLLSDYVCLNILSLITLPIFPLSIIIIPIMNLLEFKYLYYKVTKIRKNYDEAACLIKEEGFYLTIIYCMGVFYIAIFHSILYIGVFQHNNYMICLYDTVNKSVIFSLDNRLCGPFPSMISPGNVVFQVLISLPIIGNAYFLLSSPLFVCILLIIITTKWIYSSDFINPIRFLIKEKSQELLVSLNQMSDKVERLRNEKKDIQLKALEN